MSSRLGYSSSQALQIYLFKLKKNGFFSDAMPCLDCMCVLTGSVLHNHDQTNHARGFSEKNP